jgi:heptosyltransferase-2
MAAARENILVRGVNWLGDAVMTTPALTRLRQARPDARITLLSPEKLAGLWEGQSIVDEVLTFSASESVWQVGRRLRERQFTAAVAFPNSARSALELCLAGIPKRVGVGNFGRSLLLTQTVPAPPAAFAMRKRSTNDIRHRIQHDGGMMRYPVEAHHVHNYLRLTAVLGASLETMAPRIEISNEELGTVRGKFGLTSAGGGPWFGLNPGAEYGPTKRWPRECFVEAAKALQDKTGCRWVIFGGEGDVSLAEWIERDLADASGQPPLNLAGRTSLRELAGALKLCSFVLTNDTGPMHLAAAVGTPLVAIFGSTSPELTGPVFSPRARVVRTNVPCSPCFRQECPIDLRCLHGINIDEVVTAATECLKT